MKKKLEKNSLEKIISLFKYNMEKYLTIGRGHSTSPQSKKNKTVEHTFKVGDIKKAGVNGTAFTTNITILI